MAGVTSFRIRVELDDIIPAIWREIEVFADLPLPVLHQVLQQAMGWQDLHLHGFRRPASADQEAQIWSADPELLSSGMFGRPDVRDEREATVTDLLGGVGGRAVYDYDFGDDWEHELTVLAVRDVPAEEQPQARVLAGERACPPEDCGGVPGYHRLVESVRRLAADPAATIEAQNLDLLEVVFGQRDPEQMLAALDRFDVAIADHQVRAVTAPVPQLRADVAAAVEYSQAAGSSLLVRMIQAARLDEALEPDGQTCAAMMAHLTWLLRYVGAEGLTLTSAGYLRPDDVRAVAEELDLRGEWYGTMNRENQTLPVRDFREAAQGLGLVRKAKGRLSLTVAGGRLADDPVGLWRHVAARLPLGNQEFDKTAGLVVMLVVASRPVAVAARDASLPGLAASDAVPPDAHDEDLEALPQDPGARWQRYLDERDALEARLASAVADLGWRTDDGPLAGFEVRDEARLTLAVLRRCGVLAGDGPDMSWAPTAHGLELLRAALRG